jgi:hypothetical protein
MLVIPLFSTLGLRLQAGPLGNECLPYYYVQGLMAKLASQQSQRRELRLPLSPLRSKEIFDSKASGLMQLLQWIAEGTNTPGAQRSDTIREHETAR